MGLLLRLSKSVPPLCNKPLNLNVPPFFNSDLDETQRVPCKLNYSNLLSFTLRPFAPMDENSDILQNHQSFGLLLMNICFKQKIKTNV